MKLLPTNISMENRHRAAEQPTSEDLIDWFTRKAIFVSEQGGKDSGAN